MKLLLVDDEWITRDGIMDSIPWSSLGIEKVEEAEDGLQALELADRLHPDILLTDVRMPRMDGTELAYRIRRRHPGCHIIFMSGYTDKEYMKAAINVSAAAYVEKPIDLAELRSAIEKAVFLSLQDKQLNDMKQTLQNSILALKHELALHLIRKSVPPETLAEWVRLICPDLPVESEFITIVVKPPAERKYAEDYKALLLKTMAHMTQTALAGEGFPVILSVKDDEWVVAHCCVENDPSGERIVAACHRLAAALNQAGRAELSIGRRVTRLFHVHDSYMSAIANFTEPGNGLADSQVKVFTTEAQAAHDSKRFPKPRKNPAVSEILKYIDEHYADEELSLQQISRHMYLTPSYICVIFKEEMNSTINQYIAHVRMERAKEALRDRRMKVKDVAARVGFSDSNYFAKMFKKQTGLTPKEFREIAVE